MQLKSVQLMENITEHSYPFSLPLIQNFTSLTFEKPITILVGENGTGKSTFLEALASSASMILISGETLDKSFMHAITLGEKFKLGWSIKSKNGFFFRADDFINFIRNSAQIKKDAEEKLKEIRERSPHSLEVLPYARTIGELNQLYGNGLDTRSHGESFLDLFQARFRPNGLYILDEPEAPLSPMKQIALLSMIMEMIKDGAQFIIATHSPIIMALPNADIYELDSGYFEKKDYQDLEHVQLTKLFLENPERFIRHL
ncbi:AAA family ATPase [Caldibacillus lycopersici]|uniref:AAA family ATPase n=1 Tax=Perspicuibacillus lycopersici TaxID=1325689 RepID=A0AAE3ITR1_9BACI|nr:AAA family ATPase [Perspicuibacillus lycopersici]MCU9614468.1 AAA family ATPase [Perspicuibacillus lycopersici]